jgi:hypothetical protein
MIAELIGKSMKKALANLAKNQSVTTKYVSLFIHTKPTEFNPETSPKYFCAVGGKPIYEDGKVKDLRFIQDVLGEKMDLLGKEYHASNFFTKYFLSVSEKHKIAPSRVYIRIDESLSEDKDFEIGIYDKGELLEEVSLTDIFTE